MPERLKILDLVKQRFPEQSPVTTIVDWVEELANTKVFGSTEPNVLGINEVDDQYLFVLQSLLEGASIEEMKSTFRGEFGSEGSRVAADRVLHLYEQIRNSMLFKSIFLSSTRAAESCQSVRS